MRLTGDVTNVRGRLKIYDCENQRTPTPLSDERGGRTELFCDMMCICQRLGVFQGRTFGGEIGCGGFLELSWGLRGEMSIEVTVLEAIGSGSAYEKLPQALGVEETTAAVARGTVRRLDQSR